MRITGTDYSPIEVTAELIAAHGITARATSAFFAQERTSHDWLVTAWKEKLEVVLASFKRYGTEVAETQFIRDHGVDVRMCFDTKSGTSRRIGFQIKSNSEADRDATRPRKGEPMVATLKRQAFEAEHHGVVDEWWVVSCFDLSTHRKLVNSINAEVMSGKPGALRMRHVTPAEAMAFLAMDSEEIDAACTLLLCRDDEVLRMARQELRDLGPVAQRIVLESLGPALEGERHLPLAKLTSSAASETREESDLIVQDINALESAGFLKSAGDGNSFNIEPSVFVGLCALYFEGRSRHEYDPDGARKFLRLMTGDSIRRTYQH